MELKLVILLNVYVRLINIISENIITVNIKNT